MADTWISELTGTPEGMRLYHRERIILEMTELICALMDERGVNRSELARRLGKTKGYVTQLLDGETNMTLRTVSDVLWALDSSLRASAGPLDVELGGDAGDRNDPVTRTWNCVWPESAGVGHSDGAELMRFDAKTGKFHWNPNAVPTVFRINSPDPMGSQDERSVGEPPIRMVA